MAAFVIRYGPAAARYVLPFVAGGARITARGTAYVVRPAVEFTRAAVTGAPRYIPLVGSQGARATTIYISTRAGLQARAATFYAAKAAVRAAPTVTYYVARTATRTVVRDAMSPYRMAVHSYQLARLNGVARGTTNVVFRTVDAWLARSGRFLNGYGVAPTFTASAGTIARIPIYYAAYEGLPSVQEVRDAASRTYAYAMAEYQNLASRVPARDGTSVPAVVHVPVAPYRSTPVGSAPVQLPPSTNPALVPVSQRGTPIIYTPPVRRR